MVKATETSRVDFTKEGFAAGKPVAGPELQGAERCGGPRSPWSGRRSLRSRTPSGSGNPIDAFILGEEAGSQRTRLLPEADRVTLIRRLSFDLHGLPPTPEEIDAFVSDKSENAYDTLVDRLLKSPRYGERWGRHWLDIVHYGDTHGYDRDKRRPYGFPYRDYVIKSLNDDKPYSRFLREQLAGDVLFPKDPDALIATGFIAAGPWDFEAHFSGSPSAANRRRRSGI